jgi:hypothetical protein
VERAQATAEYAALALLALICACVLVQFETPVKRLAIDIAHIVEHRSAPHRWNPDRRHAAMHDPRRRLHHHCLCPFSAQ